MALIIILSVYNGFGSIISTMYENVAPDLKIEPSKGKILDLQRAELQDIIASGSGKALSESLFVCYPIINETVYIQYDRRQTIAKIKGVADGYSEHIAGSLKSGNFLLSDGDVRQAIVNEHLAAELMLKPAFFTPLYLFFPSRKEEISLLMPLQGLQTIKLHPGGIFASNIQEAADLIYIPLREARELLEYSDNECNTLEIFYNPTLRNTSKIEKKIRKILSGSRAYIVKDIRQQNDTMYKMMRTEKYAVYTILFFIIIIVSVNILASLSMLILDKQKDISTYYTLGASTSLLRRSFILHGWLVCMSGALPGILLGLALSLLQQHFGFIKIPGSFLVDSYPIVIQARDIVATFLGIAAIGFIMSFIPSRAISVQNSNL